MVTERTYSQLIWYYLLHQYDWKWNFISYILFQSVSLISDFKIEEYMQDLATADDPLCFSMHAYSQLQLHVYDYDTDSTEPHN